MESEPRAWELWWPGAGSVDSYTTLTRVKAEASKAITEGAVVTALYAKARRPNHKGDKE